MKQNCLYRQCANTKAGFESTRSYTTWTIRGKTKTTQTCGFCWSVFKLNWRRDVFRICSVGRSVSLSHPSLSMHLEMTELAGVLDFSSVWGDCHRQSASFFECIYIHSVPTTSAFFIPTVILLFSLWLTTLCLRPYCYKIAEAEFEPRL